MFVYDKVNKKGFYSTVHNTAFENDYYTDSVEQQLANEIEGKANPILEKLRSCNKITVEEKRYMAKYFTVLFKRVPKARQFFNRVSPGIQQKMRIKAKELVDSYSDQELRDANENRNDLLEYNYDLINGFYNADNKEL